MIPSRLRVTKSNALVNASYRLSLNELRIVLYALSKINPLDEGFKMSHKIDARDMAVFFGIDTRVNKTFFKDIEDALVNRFWEREFSYFDEKEGKIIKERWLIRVAFGGKNPHEMEFYYNPMIKDQLQQLSKQFTSYLLSNVNDMKSTFSVRIYEMAILHLNASKSHQSHMHITIGELKDRLCIEGKYKQFSELRIRVLEVAKKEINKKSDIKIDFSFKKIGRSVHSIDFTITRKKAEKARKSTKKNIVPGERCDKTQDMFALKIKTETLEKAKAMCQAKRADIYAIKAEFEAWSNKKGEEIKNIDAAFIGFVKRKIA
jgi:plasmid replication initiation protein